MMMIRERNGIDSISSVGWIYLCQFWFERFDLCKTFDILQLLMQLTQREMGLIVSAQWGAEPVINLSCKLVSPASVKP